MGRDDATDFAIAIASDHADSIDRLLGITGLHRAGLRRIGAAVESMYGCKSMSLGLVRPPGCAEMAADIHTSQKPTDKKKSTINHHLSRFYPQMVGPHKRK